MSQGGDEVVKHIMGDPGFNHLDYKKKKKKNLNNRVKRLERAKFLPCTKLGLFNFWHCI